MKTSKQIESVQWQDKQIIETVRNHPQYSRMLVHVCILHYE